MTTIASGAEERADAAITEEEEVGLISIRIGPGGPIVAALASMIEVTTWTDPSAPHKE